MKIEVIWVYCVCVIASRASQSVMNRFYYKVASTVVDGVDMSAAAAARSLTECAVKCSNVDGSTGGIFCKTNNICSSLSDINTTSPVPVPSSDCKVFAATTAPCTPPARDAGRAGEPRLLIAMANDITLYGANGSMLWTETLSQSSRAMAYYHRKNRIYLGTNPVTSIQLDGGDNQTHGTNYSGTILGMSIDECRDLIYLSVSGDRVVKMTSDGTWTIMAPELEVSKPRQNQLNLEDNVLYWADEGFKTMKSVKTNEASPVTTMFTSTSTVWGMDVDIPAQKIYWCAKSTGDVWVFDMSTSINTQLVPNGGPVSGSCSGLRLYNDYIYLIYYRHGYVEKRSKDGLLVEKLLDGVIPGAKTKYMAIIE